MAPDSTTETLVAAATEDLLDSQIISKDEVLAAAGVSVADEGTVTIVAEPVQEPDWRAKLASIRETLVASDIPENADYRVAADAQESCGTCDFYENGECSKWGTGVEPDYTCNSWAAETAETTVEGVALEGVREEAAVEPEVVVSETLPATNPSPDEPVPVQPTRDDRPGLQWNATFAPEGVLTDDGRAFAPGSIGWRELPLTLMAMLETSEGGHVGAQVAGRIDDVFRQGNLIMGAGIFDDGDYGQEIARLVDDRTLRGISVDIAVESYEYGPRDQFFDAEGVWLTERPEVTETEEPDLMDVLFGGDDLIFVVTKGTIGAVTVCPFPAFADANIQLAASLVAGAKPLIWTLTMQGDFRIVAKPKPLLASAEPDTAEMIALLTNAPAGLLGLPGLAAEEIREEAGFLTAAAAGLAPVKPPADWFADPTLEDLTPITVADDGHVYGHAWAWDTCHIGIPGVCTTAPRTETNYAYYLLKEIECDDGARLAVGTITLDTDHADRQMGRGAATAHYDHTGTAVADVVFGEDEHGGWFSGALRPDVDAEKVRDLRGAVISGDWRDVNGNLELVALLAVNVPGFPVPRTPSAAIVASGEQQRVLSLVAAGMHRGKLDMTDEELAAKVQALRDRAAGRFAELAARARGDEAA